MSVTVVYRSAADLKKSEFWYEEGPKMQERAIKAEAEVERLNKMIDGLLLDLQMVATDESTEGYPCICSICELACKCPDDKRDPYSNKDSLCKFVWRGLKDGRS